ncbi:MAG TPA: CDP-alcohol phosphatidyltransferase, partial [Microbacterium sp.]|nr:CDP-alcohol phosphatidyltransferase [Microbacterium sp.]
MRRNVSLMFAILLLVVVPLVPGALAGGSPAPLIGIPAESIVVLLLLCLLPSPPARVVAAVGFGVIIVIAFVLAGIDAGYEAVLDIPFDPLDWQQLGDAFGVVQGSVGAATASGLVALLAVAAAGLIGALSWAALRVGAAVSPARAHGTIVMATVTTAWAIAAVTGSQLVAGQPAAAAASLHAITASASHAAEGLAARADLRQQIASDPYRDTRGSDLLTSLRGKDVVFAFIESYGKVAVDDESGLSAGVQQVLRDGEAQLRADGYASQSAFLTSPTFGGVSWLAHSTFQTGLWVDRQALYNKVIRSDRLTLSDAFGAAGWRTVSVIPSNTEPWSFGSSFYHWETMLDANNVGYRGPRFGYARIPDQYTWKHFADHELAGDQPVMAEIDLVSSHTPWAPLPKLVPWAEVGDGSVFRPQPAQDQSATEVWQDPERVREAYARSIQYSLGAMFAFLHNSDDPNLVLVVLGDHQPATIVSGHGASHDVPISIISKDPAVFESISGWRWQEGMLPA